MTTVCAVACGAPGVHLRKNIIIFIAIIIIILITIIIFIIIVIL